MFHLIVNNPPHLVCVGSDFSIVEPEHIEPLVVLKAAKIPALLLNIEFLDVANIDTVLEMRNQVGPCSKCVLFFRFLREQYETLDSIFGL